MAHKCLDLLMSLPQIRSARASTVKKYKRLLQKPKNKCIDWGKHAKEPQYWKNNENYFQNEYDCWRKLKIHYNEIFCYLQVLTLLLDKCRYHKELTCKSFQLWRNQVHRTCACSVGYHMCRRLDKWLVRVAREYIENRIRWLKRSSWIWKPQWRQQGYTNFASRQ